MSPAGTSAIGIDIGGTSARVGHVDRDSNVLAFQSFPTPRSYHELLGALVAVTRDTLLIDSDRNECVHTPVGMALPALFDRDSGNVQRCVNLPFLEGRSLRKDLGKALDTAVATVTDAEAATWAEYDALGEFESTFAHLRLGTGVALGVVRNGRLLNLTGDRSGHLPELVVDDAPHARLCPCGARGCLEGFVSAMRTAASDPTPATWDLLAQGIALAIANIHGAFGAVRFCIGGGLFKGRPALHESVREATAQSLRHSPGNQPIELCAARCDDAAGVIGAAQLAARPQLLAPLMSVTT